MLYPNYSINSVKVLPHTDMFTYAWPSNRFSHMLPASSPSPPFTPYTPPTQTKKKHHRRPSPLKQKHHDTRGALAACLLARRRCRHGLVRQRTSGSDDSTSKLRFPLPRRDDRSVQRLLEGWRVDIRNGWFSSPKDLWSTWITLYVYYINSAIYILSN